MMQKVFKNSPGRVVRYVDVAGYQGVRLPYKGCSISAIALLPSEAAVQEHGFAAAVAELKIEELLDLSKWDVRRVEVHMPRFKVKQECMSLKGVSGQCHCSDVARRGPKIVQQLNCSTINRLGVISTISRQSGVLCLSQRLNAVQYSTTFRRGVRLDTHASSMQTSARHQMHHIVSPSDNTTSNYCHYALALNLPCP